MSNFRIKFADEVDLKKFFSEEVTFFLIKTDKVKRPYSFSIIKENGVGIRFRSFVYQVEDRLEVGSINIDHIEYNLKEEDIKELPKSFKNILNFRSGKVKESHVDIESGFLLTSFSEERIYILPGEMPFSIYIKSSFLSDSFASEYNISDYVFDQNV